MTRILLTIVSATVLVGCASPTAPDPGGEITVDLPETIVGCEFFRVEVCWTWEIEGDQYIHTGSDGATAHMEILRFTEAEIVLRRVDYGLHEDFTALYAGMVRGQSVRSGAVTWNHQGNVRAGEWWWEW